MPAQGIEANRQSRPPHPGVFSPPAPAADRRPDLQPAADDYAHVFYELSETRGFHVFVRTANGGEREITGEPDWQGRHKAALQRLRQTRREDYVRRHSELDPWIRDAVTAGMLVQGMNTEQVRACVGNAIAESRTLTREGLVEEWRYGMAPVHEAGELSMLEGENPCGSAKPITGGRECLLHFRDGVLVGWESPVSAGAFASPPRPR